MGIIRDEDRIARQDYLQRSTNRSDRIALALQELKDDREAIVSDIVNSARRNYIEKGTLPPKAVTKARKLSAAYLAGNPEAQNMIAEWLREYEPNLTPRVRIGPDCSGRLKTTAEIVVEFTPTH